MTPTAHSAYFDTIVRHETALWNGVDAGLAAAGVVGLGNLELLRIVDSAPDVRVQDVSRRLRITVGAASKMTDRVEREGLVERVEHPSDRRSSLVRITPNGSAALAAAERAFESVFTAMFDAADAAVFESATAAIRRLDALLTQRKDALS